MFLKLLCTKLLLLFIKHKIKTRAKNELIINKLTKKKMN